MIGIRLKEERERLGLTQPVFAEIAGAKKRTLIDWEQGVSSPTAVQLSALSAAGVDAIYVLTGNRNLWLDTPPTATDPMLVKHSALEKLQLEEARPITAPEGFILVPRYEVQASAGGGALIHSEMIVNYLAFEQTWIAKMGLSRDKLALIEVHGDSMVPELNNQDLILVDMRMSELSANGIYVIQLNGHLLVKRIQTRMDGSVTVISDNPKYAPELLTAEQAQSLIVLGLVVWSGRRM